MNDVIDKTISFELLYFIHFWIFKILCLKNENFLVGSKFTGCEFISCPMRSLRYTSVATFTIILMFNVPGTYIKPTNLFNFTT